MNDVVIDQGVSVSQDVLMLQLMKYKERAEKAERESEALRNIVKNEQALSASLIEKKQHRKRREVTADDNDYKEFKSDGVRKPSPADSIRSYDDFVKMQNYFLSKGDVRDYALWTVGVGTGLRVSDLISLQYRNVLESTTGFRERIKMFEKKTGKPNNVLLTEGVTEALRRYCESIKWEFDENDFIFSSQKGRGKVPMAPQYAWHLISNAGKELGLPLNFGSHTMRKSFANIVACADRSTVDMNVITKVQGLLNHSDQRVTMKYLGTFNEMYDKARQTVSDFILGKTGMNSLVASEKHSLEDLFERIEALERTLKDG